MPFLQFSALVPIFQCGLLGASLDHKEANMSVMKFFHDLINQGISAQGSPDFPERQRLVTNLLEQYGHMLVSGLLQACVFHLHTYMLSEVNNNQYNLFRSFIHFF